MRDNAIRIIPRAYRRRGAAVAATLLLRALLNFAGLAVLLPVLALVLDPQSITQNQVLAGLYEFAGFDSPRAFALAVCGAVVAVIAVKCLLNIYLARFERNYIYDLYRTLSRQLYVTYHDRGLSFVKSHNSAQLARNINVVCLAFTAGVLRPAAAILVEVVLFVLLFGAMALYTPLAAGMTLLVFLPGVWLYYGLVRTRSARYGEEENRAQREKARVVAETFRGYADIEINGAFPMMLRAFDCAMDKVVRMRAKEFSINILPQTFTEIGLAAGMALLAALSIGKQDGSSALLFGAFAVAALRLMPSVRNIMTGWAAIKYNRYTLEILHDAQAGDEPADSSSQTKDDEPAGSRSQAADGDMPAAEKLPFEREIAVRGLTFRFDDGTEDVFNGYSLVIRKGEYVGIRGESGAGKTTLFNLLLGLYSPTGGEICIDGEQLTAANRRAWQQRIGYVSQNLFLTDGSFAANVALGIPQEEVDRQRVEEALHMAQLGEFIAGLPRGIDTPVGECGCRLSGGQRQRIGIARALYRQADVLFFDEATSALDSRTEEEINRSIARIAAQQKGLTIVAIAHRESSLEHCDRIITIEK